MMDVISPSIRKFTGKCDKTDTLKLNLLTELESSGITANSNNFNKDDLVNFQAEFNKSFEKFRNQVCNEITDVKILLKETIGLKEEVKRLSTENFNLIKNVADMKASILIL